MLKTLPLLLAVWLLQLIVTEGAPASQPDCGQPRISSRIVGGQDAPDGEWPWHVSICLDHHPICGGSLIDEQWVLTAASCFHRSHSTEKYVVVLGANQLLNLSQNVATSNVVKLFIPPDYLGKVGSPADIALLKLASPVPFTSHILPVCLPKSSEQFSVPLTAPLTLQEAKVPIIDQKTCNSLFSASPVEGMEKDPVMPDMICAGYPQGGIDACKGDGGGPLVCKVGRRWTQAGIVSWGVGCAESSRPGVYTSVPFYSFWIKDKIRTE
ncbi:serine protease 27-like [Candoia aspera]|uniref:serine protease 27-like n=1 Tax=Candoia aspera TaxID=51853 RepID=UPI002FD877AB